MGIELKGNHPWRLLGLDRADVDVCTILGLSFGYPYR